jgi:hypothetical protein
MRALRASGDAGDAGSTDASSVTDGDVGAPGASISATSTYTGYYPESLLDGPSTTAGMPRLMLARRATPAEDSTAAKGCRSTFG